MPADHLVSSQAEHGVTLVGPVNPDPSWQAKAQHGFDVATFAIDWDQQTAICPEGRTSVLWMPGQDRHEHPVINIRFARADCEACAARAKCTHASTQPRVITVRTREQHEAPQANRQRQTTEAFKENYAKRAGIEGAISQRFAPPTCAVRVTLFSKNALTESDRRRCHQFAAGRKLAKREATCPNAPIAFCGSSSG